MVPFDSAAQYTYPAYTVGISKLTVRVSELMRVDVTTRVNLGGIIDRVGLTAKRFL